MIDTTTIGNIIGTTAHSTDGERIGSVEQVYIDQESGRATWATVRTGLFGTHESFVPLEGADFDGESLRVAYDKSSIKGAPRVDADGALTAYEEAELYRYYGLDQVSDPTPARTRTGSPVRRGTGSDGAGHDTSGPDTDVAMTRSEEHLHVGTERVEAGRARLRKYIVTEEQTVTVPVRHEEARIRREPITEAMLESSTLDAELAEEEYEVILSTERVVVAKTAVPVERVRLDTETVTEERRVTEEVRHEEITLETDDLKGPRDRA